jgi:YEATS domain-containing protein 4
MVDAIATASKAGTSSVASSDPAAPRRLEKTTACLPFVYGSVAFYLGKKADDFQTHQWTLYVRGPNNEDLSLVISKVIFQLHPSFAQPIRELTAPPFEVTERGWGEFEAQIRIIWKDPFEKATVVCYRTITACRTSLLLVCLQGMYTNSAFSYFSIDQVAQGIKLYPPGTPVNAIPTNTEKPVVAETYDEVVFTDPTESFYGQLMQLSSATKLEYSQQDHFEQFVDNDDLQALLEAQKFLKQELVTVKERLLTVDVELQEVGEGLREVQERKVTTAQRASAKTASRGAGTSTSSNKKAKTN